MLSRVSTDLPLAGSQAEVARVAVRHLNALAHGPAVALAPVGGQLRLIAAEPQDYLPEASELEAADVAFRRGRPEFASAQGWSGSRLTFQSGSSQKWLTSKSRTSSTTTEETRLRLSGRRSRTHSRRPT